MFLANIIRAKWRPTMPRLPKKPTLPQRTLDDYICFLATGENSAPVAEKDLAPFYAHTGDLKADPLRVLNMETVLMSLVERMEKLEALCQRKKS
jgi:hypothetical protein